LGKDEPPSIPTVTSQSQTDEGTPNVDDSNDESVYCNLDNDSDAEGDEGDEATDEKQPQINNVPTN